MMDQAKRFHIYSNMTKREAQNKAIKLAEVAEMLREYIDAIPKDIELPVMPGMDRDWVDSVIDEA